MLRDTVSELKCKKKKKCLHRLIYITLNSITLTAGQYNGSWVHSQKWDVRNLRPLARKCALETPLPVGFGFYRDNKGSPYKAHQHLNTNVALLRCAVTLVWLT